MTSLPLPFGDSVTHAWLAGAACALLVVLVVCLIAGWLARHRTRSTRRRATDGTRTARTHAGAVHPTATVPVDAASLTGQYQQLENRLAALADALDTQRQMNSLMSHELRSPISTISAAVQSLELILAGSDASVENRLQRIGRSIQRVTELMDQLLSQDVFYEQALAPTHASVDLVDLAHGVAAGLRQEAAHELVVRAAQSAPAWCDGPLTGVVLRNLVHNAIKYSPADQPIVIEIGTQPAPDGTIAWMAVTDRGPGIEPEDQARIFEPNYRRAAHRETKGLGIGLHLVRKICERQNGTLTVESEPGKGSRFIVSLPAAQAANT
ncbi:MAG TPA: HAMP domain-containing sensor histidine kinase [Bordetella sp.]|jgi:signal transduction histidine kinase|nr:HAMP domain-containing sensor histidine kinase [Bordetella sp.]